MMVSVSNACVRGACVSNTPKGQASHAWHGLPRATPTRSRAIEWELAKAGQLRCRCASVKPMALGNRHLARYVRAPRLLRWQRPLVQAQNQRMTAASAAMAETARYAQVKLGVLFRSGAWGGNAPRLISVHGIANHADHSADGDE